jgi:Tfp pilus assembly protein PilP
MEERMSLGEAFKVAVGNLTGTNEEGKTARLLFLLLFLVGSVYAAFCYQKSLVLLEEKSFFPSRPPTETAADKKRLTNMVDEVRKTSEARANSAVAVRSMREMEKYVFAEPLPTASSARASAGTEDFGGEADDYPPEGIVLRAVMLMGKQSVAVIDIPGVGSGMIFKVGDTFMEKKGRVVRISPDKVVLRWGGKNWDVVPGF